MEENLFGAKVEKISPVHIDERGEIKDLLNKSINHVGFITTKAGVVRANHYHKLSTQYNYVSKGKFQVLLASAEDASNVKKVILETGDFIEIPPKVIHQFKAIEDADLIDMISESRAGTGFEDDVVRVEIEEGGLDN